MLLCQQQQQLLLKLRRYTCTMYNFLIVHCVVPKFLLLLLQLCLKRSVLRVVLGFRLLLIRSYAASKVSLDCHVYLLFQHFSSAVCSFSYSLIAFPATLMIVFLLISRRFWSLTRLVSISSLAAYVALLLFFFNRLFLHVAVSFPIIIPTKHVWSCLQHAPN